MTHSVSITDGTNTMSLSSSNVLLTNYVPQTPDISGVNRSTVGDGTPVDMPAYENVTDTIEILFENSSKSDLQGQINALNRYLLLAKRRQQTKAGPRVYLQLQVDGDSDTYRSEILTGRLVLDENALRHYANIKVQAALIVERVYFWEGPESEIAIKTSNTSAGTGGRTIYNHDDSGTGHDNWVQMASGQIDGDLPTPARVTLQNITGSSQGYRDFYIGTNAYSDPANFTHIIEGEDALFGSTGSSGNSSGGQHLSFTVTGTANVQWTLSGSQLQKTGGRFFKLIMRLASISAGCYIQAQIRDKYGTVKLYESGEVYVDSAVRLVDLGAVPLPPGTEDITWSDMRLYLAFRSTSSTIDLDFVQLTPTDGYAHIEQLGNDIVDDEIITFDGVAGVNYASDNGPIYSSSMPTIWLFPNQLQRLIFLHNEGTGTPTIANTFSVRVYARPRRLTI